LLLDFLALEQDLSFDFVIIDTAVCDAIMAHTLTRERARETLEIFISCLKARSNAQIIILTIATKMALLAPGTHWQELLYRDIAARFRLPILDGFKLVRGLVGPVKMLLASRATARVRRLGMAFGLPDHLHESMAWRTLREPAVPSNALGLFGFNDHIHFSRALHALVFELLRNFIAHPPQRRNQDDCVNLSVEETPLVIAAKLNGGTTVRRFNSWISRDLSLLSSGEVGQYVCPAGYRAYGLLFNVSNTACVLRMTSRVGETTLDLHNLPQITNWIARIDPIGEDIGDGNIEVEVLEKAAITACSVGSSENPSRAELGELIMVRADWRNFVRPVPQEAAPVLHIETLPSAKSIIADAAARAAQALYSMEAQGRFVDEACDRFATELLTKTQTPLSLSDQARLLLVLGRIKDLAAFLANALEQAPDDRELLSMISALQAMDVEDVIGKDELLRRARDKALAGAIREAEALYEEGMARFTSEVLFWFEHASLAQQRRDWPEATRRWEMMRELFPRHESWCMGLYISLRYLGRIKEAEEHLNSVVIRCSDFADAAAAHALLPLDKDDAPAALERLKSVRQRFPNQLSNRKALIELLIKEGDLVGAREELSVLVDEGRVRHDLLELATKLADSPQGFDWLGSVWNSLASCVPDRAWLTNQTVALFNRFSATNKCDFLLPWMPEIHGRESSQAEPARAVGV
jgi:tetratricopeptide (TPR) repeat protein